jgi:hypothetical protein
MHLTYDNRLNEEDFVLQLIHDYRARIIEQHFRDKGDVLPLWQQPYIIPRVDKVDKNEDIFVDLEKDFGKFHLPRLVQFPNRNESNLNRALTHVIDAYDRKEFFPISYEKWMSVRNSTTERSRYDYYFAVGDFIYMTRYVEKVSVRGIFWNPLQAHIIDNVIKQSGSLVIGETYIVKNGAVVHNGQTVTAPNTFIAQTTTYSGEGLVYRNSAYRLLEMTDNYPFKDSHVPLLKQAIWNEFNIAASSFKDQQGNADEEADIQTGNPNAPAPGGE